MTYTKTYILRAVQTKTIQFLQSMSESDGSEIQRFFNWMMIVSKLIEHDFIQSQNRSMSDPPLSDTDFKNKMALVWTTLKVRKLRIFKKNHNGLAWRGIVGSNHRLCLSKGPWNTSKRMKQKKFSWCLQIN